MSKNIIRIIPLCVDQVYKVTNEQCKRCKAILSK